MPDGEPPKKPTSRFKISSGLYTTTLIYVSVQIAVLSFFSSYYNFGFRNATDVALGYLEEFQYTRDTLDWIRDSWEETKENLKIQPRKAEDLKAVDAEVHTTGSKKILTPEQLKFFDGTRDSKPIYLAILGRVYDVNKGKKHYGVGGGYHFFSGRDATRAFVTGDFSEEGLTDSTEGLSHEDLLGIRDWLSFYEKDYSIVGVVSGRYYDSEGNPTSELEEVLARIETANDFRKMKSAEAEVFPPCNSEWHQKTGGRVWCSTKSGGINRDWAGVPRLLLDPATKQKRCACVKNFGVGLSGAESVKKSTNRGDLDHPHLKTYSNCSPTANSCKITDDD
ncbi:unnamed protein product [Caenorhabditis auriculariae]|uniref:Cytochrome b5 heme-binding domain-containing protein n=1 Tax=Caenorhabditis auriculariae TaxID=2777116 RepID=A0A8S1GX76_9PELO|nr:unnamed protein product [Caenorhabditis auriculariae]